MAAALGVCIAFTQLVSSHVALVTCQLCSGKPWVVTVFGDVQRGTSPNLPLVQQGGWIATGWDWLLDAVYVGWRWDLSEFLPLSFPRHAGFRLCRLESRPCLGPKWKQEASPYCSPIVGDAWRAGICGRGCEGPCCCLAGRDRGAPMPPRACRYWFKVKVCWQCGVGTEG